MINEKTVLGACFLDPASIDEAAVILNSEDFKDSRHRDIFSAMLELKSADEPVSDVSIINKFNASGNNCDWKYLGELMDFTPTSSNIKYYAKKIKEASIVRRVLDLTFDMQLRIERGDTDGILPEFESRLLSVGDTSVKYERKMSEIMKDVFKDLEAASKCDGTILGLPTGFKLLDQVTGGLQGGKLYVVGGRPGMGKSAFMVNLMDTISVKHDFASILYSLEMKDTELGTRELCSLANVISSHIASGRLQSADYGRMTTAAGRLQSAEIYIDDTESLHIDDLRSRARRAVRRHGCKLIMVDYLQLCRGTGGSREQEIGYVSRNLKGMAKELNVPVVALAQLNRGVENRSDKRPIMADLRDSGAIEQDADGIFFLYRDVVYNDTAAQDQGELGIAKMRGGKSGIIIPLIWQGEYTRYLDIDTPTGRIAGVHNG